MRALERLALSGLYLFLGVAWSYSSRYGASDLEENYLGIFFLNEKWLMLRRGSFDLIWQPYKGLKGLIRVFRAL